MGLFSNRTRSSINLSNDITGSITKCHNGSFGLKLVHLWVFKDFFILPFFHILIKINEYANKIICITYHWKKGLCLSFKKVPCSLV